MADSAANVISSVGPTSTWTRNLQNLPPITQDIIDKWANKAAKIPRSKQTKGYSNFIEGYIHEVEVKKFDTKVHVRARAYPSMKKNNPPYRLMVELSSTSNISGSQCECKAGNGHCSHSIGLLYLLCHYGKLGLKAVPPIQSKTSLPQTWHIPQRHQGLAQKPIDSLKISKVNPKKEPKTKKRKITEGILPSIYCPVPQPIPYNLFTSSLISQLTAMKSDAQILRTLSSSKDVSMSKFGPVPSGSVLSYQQKPAQSSGDIIHHMQEELFPEFSMPHQVNIYQTVLNHRENDMVMGLQTNTQLSSEIEKETRLQSSTKLWHDVRRHRLTSTMFKDICVRRADFETLATRLFKNKIIQTSAMKYGLEYEPIAAKLYSEVTDNNVYMCGFVINPSVPYLGASPDRKVFDPTSLPHHGLLEIKCPDKDSFEECKYLKKCNDGMYKLKHTHQYYYQVMGQMGLTGLKWCDFFVKCRNDYHKERVHFDAEKWEDILMLLDKFYFEYFLAHVISTM